MTRYYLTLRPPMMGCMPKGFAEVEDFGGKRPTGHGFDAWGWVEYPEPLTPEKADAYDLREA